MPPRPVDKPIDWRIRELDCHLHFLSEALINMREDWLWYKVVASELRILICGEAADSGDSLVSFVMRATNFSSHTDLIEGKHYWVMNGQKKAATGRIPIPDFWKNIFQVELYGVNYTAVRLVQEIANGEGSCHEHPRLPAPLYESHLNANGDVPEHVSLLYEIARDVVKVTSACLQTLEESRDYQPIYNTRALAKNFGLGNPVRSKSAPE